MIHQYSSRHSQDLSRLMYLVPCSQFLRIFSRLGWLHGKANCQTFEKLSKSIRMLKMKQIAFFFKRLNKIAFLNCNNLRKRQKERLSTFFPAILDRLLSRQAKLRFFKSGFQRFKWSKLGPGFETLVKYS